MTITGGFGFEIDLITGQHRHWSIGRDGVKRWSDTNTPIDQNKNYPQPPEELKAIDACMTCLGDDAAILANEDRNEEIAENMLKAEMYMRQMTSLLQEVRCNFTRDDDMPDGLLGRIDAVLDAV